MTKSPLQKNPDIKSLSGFVEILLNNYVTAAQDTMDNNDKSIVVENVTPNSRHMQTETT